MYKQINEQLAINDQLDDLLAKARLGLALFLTGGPGQVAPQEIEDLYRKAFSSYLNSRKIAEELEHYYYFLYQLPIDDAGLTAKRKELQGVVQTLEQLRKMA